MRGSDPRLIEGPRGITTRRLLALLLLGCVLALLLGSRPLATWAAKLPDPLQNAASRWDAAMQAAGLTVPYDAIHALIRDWSG